MLEPPVSWLKSSSGRASASVTFTLSRGRSSSSATIMALEVVTPWPTSARGRAKWAVPSASRRMVMRWLVGRAARVRSSFRSRSSAGPGRDGTSAGAAAAASAGARASTPSRAATVRVGAARTYPRNRRRLMPGASPPSVLPGWAVPSPVPLVGWSSRTGCRLAIRCALRHGPAPRAGLSLLGCVDHRSCGRPSEAVRPGGCRVAVKDRSRPATRCRYRRSPDRVAEGLPAAGLVESARVEREPHPQERTPQAFLPARKPRDRAGATQRARTELGG